MQEVHLAAAFEFTQHRFADDAAAGALHEGLDCQTLLRRGGDDRELAQAFHCQAERTRDGGGGQGQDVDLAAQGFQRFFLTHTETVLLVDDDQPQTLEHHVLLQQAMGADDDVHLAFAQMLQCLGLFLGGFEA
ncbi:hypothetical protein SDC9_159180 [bioreactor metagenome]|uniref:Uncharacterized protein n=1 Tax=bioreactor metagenome TaxID=1076179 RepID=A0A645FEG9_9ZZZZ